jgi:hypothetical protein
MRILQIIMRFEMRAPNFATTGPPQFNQIVQVPHLRFLLAGPAIFFVIKRTNTSAIRY